MFEIKVLADLKDAYFQVHRCSSSGVFSHNAMVKEAPRGYLYKDMRVPSVVSDCL